MSAEPKKPGRPAARLVAAALAAAAVLAAVGCHSPQRSQDYFASAAADDPMLELLHETALYTVYYDHALRRCVLHAAYSWGENGGGGGGTGLGIALFPCDPARLKARAEQLERSISQGEEPRLPEPAPAPAPAAGAPSTPQPSPPGPTAPPESFPGSPD